MAAAKLFRVACAAVFNDATESNHSSTIDFMELAVILSQEKTCSPQPVKKLFREIKVIR